MFAAVAQHGDHVYARAVLSSIALHVDCTLGSDSVGDGSVDRPYLSLRMARDALRGLKPPSMPADVFISGDCFPRSKHGAVDFSQPLLELQPRILARLAPLFHTDRTQEVPRRDCCRAYQCRHIRDSTQHLLTQSCRST